MAEEFSLEELHKLIDDALAGRTESTGTPTGSDAPPEPASRPGGRIPLAFNEGTLLEELARILPRYVDQADAQVILNELRGHLYEGVAMTDLRTMHSVTLNCRRCPSVSPNPALPEGNLVDPDVVFVLDNLAVGAKAGEYLTEQIAKAGFSRHRIAITALTRCPLEGFRPPSAEEVAKCSSYLNHELQMLRPKAIVTLGSGPTEALLGGAVKVSDIRGQFRWIGPWAILPTFAPGYAMRGKVENDFQADLAKAHKFAYGARPGENAG